MKLTIPTLEIQDDEGFAPSKDIFERKEFGERLIKLIESSNENLVIALDAQWGEGKTTFIKMWKGYIGNHREDKIKAIYFDAFANDYQKDPFLALAAEIYELIKGEPKKKRDEFKKKAGDALKSMARGALKIGIRAATGGVLDGTIVDTVEKDVSKLVADQVDNIIADRFESTTKDRMAIKTFREYLATFAQAKGNGKPIVFIIDELDRCRPDFALELIEQIKHLFSVPGITFLLVMHRNQLEETVKNKYGSNIKASLYLQKFIHLWLTLPRKSGIQIDHGNNYLGYVLDQMMFEDEKISNRDAIRVLGDLIKLHKSSYREVERISSFFALIHNMAGETSYIISYQCIIAFICYLKAAKPQLAELISKQAINVEELLKQSGLDCIDSKSDYCHLYDLKQYIKYDLADEALRKEMDQTGEAPYAQFGRHGKDIMITIIRWLSDIENIDS